MRCYDFFIIAVSIVVPVYNVEKYLERCLNSLVRQSFPSENYEIICVNDGSDDNSLNILNTYAEKYKNIKIITKENGGLSDARNNGLKHATGKYILFVDSDDFIALNALEVLYNYAEKNRLMSLFLIFTEADRGFKNRKSVISKILLINIRIIHLMLQILKALYTVLFRLQLGINFTNQA